MSERKTKIWWVVADGRVVESKGFSCAPANPGCWWFPEVGFSSWEGTHVFATRDEAVAKAIAELRAKRDEIDGQIRKLEPKEKP